MDAMASTDPKAIPLSSNGWKEVQRRHMSTDMTPVSAVACDSLENLVWTGSTDGQVTSFLENGDALIRYTSFPAHAQNVSQLLVNENGVYSLSNQNVRLSHRRGLQLWKKVIPGATAMSFSDLSSELIVSSGIPCKLMILNLFRGNIVKEVLYDSPVVKLKRTKSKLVCAGLQSGTVNIIDARQMRTEHSLFAHTAGIADIDVQDNTLATCGYSIRSGTVTPDPMVKIYDLRMMRSLAPLPFQAGPSFLQFVPGTYSTIAALSPAGALQICDLASKNQSNISFNQVQLDGYLTSMHFASTASMVCFGDSTGVVSVWSNTDDLKMNEFARPSEYRTFNSHVPPAHLDNDSDFAEVGMPHYTSTLLSAWPSHLTFPVGRPYPKIPAQVIEKVKMVDYVGYAPHPGTFKRNQNVAMSSMLNREAPMFRSEQERHRMRTRTQELRQNKPSAPDTGPSTLATDSGIPNSFLKVEIKYSRFGVEDFDFGFYNKTEYSGLETHMQNSYTNSVLQCLFFSEPLKRIVTTHVYKRCTREPCLTCELGFLFRMLEDGKGVNCHTSNLLRAFSMFKQAAGLGLLETFENIHHTNHAVMLQTFCRFILENIGTELTTTITTAPSEISDDVINKSISQLFQTLFGTAIVNSTTCPSGHSQIRESRIYVTDLVYVFSKASFGDTKPTSIHASPSRGSSSNNSIAGNSQSFVDLVQHSMHRVSLTKAWCPDCKEYSMISQTKNVVTLPQYLFFNVLPTTDAQLSLWVPPEGPGNQSSKSFLPMRFRLSRNDKELKVIDLDRENVEDEDEDFVEVANYSLKSIVCQIRHAKQGNHLVALINSRDPYMKHLCLSFFTPYLLDNIASMNDTPKWLLFNDFLIEEVSPDSVRQFTSWKVPVIVQYARDQTDSFSPLQAHISPTERDLSIFLSNPLVNLKKDLSIKYTLLKENELPSSPGFLCALDAEFVSLSHAETEFRSDGTKSIIRPSRFSLARVSVVRGDGPMEGVPFIDDYIATTEPIVDYLTEFSGIKPGDLDVHHSRYPLVALKYAYLKLRTLVDMGCIFVGHGLAKDFRTINIFVPPEQIIDTVSLFRIKNRQRKLSLKFLSWCLFREDIQTEAHDSIIDAQMALRLYKKYLQLNEEGIFEKTMEDIYDEGRIYNFKPPSATNAPTPGSSGPETGMPSGTAHARHHSAVVSPMPRSHSRNHQPQRHQTRSPATPTKNRNRQRYPSHDPTF